MQKERGSNLDSCLLYFLVLWLICNQDMANAIQHNSLPVTSQDKSGGLQQEVHLA